MNNGTAHTGAPTVQQLLWYSPARAHINNSTANMQPLSEHEATMQILHSAIRALSTSRIFEAVFPPLLVLQPAQGRPASSSAFEQATSLLQSLTFGPTNVHSLIEEIMTQLHRTVKTPQDALLARDRFTDVLQSVYDAFGAPSLVAHQHDLWNSFANSSNRRGKIPLTPLMAACLYFGPWAVLPLMVQRGGVVPAIASPVPSAAGNALLCVCCCQLVTLELFGAVFTAALAEDDARRAGDADSTPLWQCTMEDRSNMLHLLCNFSLMNADSEATRAATRVANCVAILNSLVDHHPDIVRDLVLQRDAHGFFPAAYLVKSWTGYQPQDVAKVLQRLLSVCEYDNLTVPVNVFAVKQSSYHAAPEPVPDIHLAFTCVQQDFAAALEVVGDLSVAQLKQKQQQDQQQPSQNEHQEPESPFIDDRKRTLIHAVAFANAMACYNVALRIVPAQSASSFAPDRDGNTAFHHLAMGENAAVTISRKHLTGLPAGAPPFHEDRTWLLQQLIAHERSTLTVGSQNANNNNNSEDGGIDLSTTRNAKQQLPHELADARRQTRTRQILRKCAGISGEDKSGDAFGDLAAMLAVFNRTNQRTNRRA